jgi:hypothetical protein
VAEHISSSWQWDTELIRKRFLEISGYPAGARCHGVVVKWLCDRASARLS